MPSIGRSMRQAEQVTFGWMGSHQGSKHYLFDFIWSPSLNNHCFIEDFTLQFKPDQPLKWWTSRAQMVNVSPFTMVMSRKRVRKKREIQVSVPLPAVAASSRFFHRPVGRTSLAFDPRQIDPRSERNHPETHQESMTQPCFQPASGG